MKRIILASFTVSLIAFAGAASAASPSQIDVMTQNQYLGTDLAPVITSPPGELNARVVQALEDVAASLPTDRLAQLSKLIAGRSPHAVVLNEAFSYSCTNAAPETPSTQGCGNQKIKGAFVDFLATTIADLGGRYVLKARVQNFGASGIPFEIDGYWAYLTVADHDAILVRSDLAPYAGPVQLSLNPACRPSLDGCNYQAVPTITTVLGDLTIERGYVAVDLLLGSKPYRIFATHLEQRELVPGNTESRVLQRMQAAELLSVATEFPALPGTRKLIVGDINSAPTDDPTPIDTLIGPLPPPYFIFTMAGGYTDTWTLRPGAQTAAGAPLIGNSCCQDEYLANRKSALYERIDMIFSLVKPVKVMDARLLGDTPAAKTWPPGLGLWPSDHASVAATLRY